MNDAFKISPMNSLSLDLCDHKTLVFIGHLETLVFIGKCDSEPMDNNSVPKPGPSSTRGVKITGQKSNIARREFSSLSGVDIQGDI